jgi:predicted transcriptional regulator
MPQLTIELDHEELERLHQLAKRKRRSDAQQAAHTLVRALERLERAPAEEAPPPQEADTAYEQAVARYNQTTAGTTG